MKITNMASLACEIKRAQCCMSRQAKWQQDGGDS